MTSTDWRGIPGLDDSSRYSTPEIMAQCAAMALAVELFGPGAGTIQAGGLGITAKPGKHSVVATIRRWLDVDDTNTAYRRRLALRLIIQKAGPVIDDGRVKTSLDALFRAAEDLADAAIAE